LNLHHHIIVIGLFATSLTGCVNLSDHPAEPAIRANVAQLTGVESQSPAVTDESPESRTQLRDQLLAKPLDADEAVRLALINNPAMQRIFADLQITETQLLAAARPRNPGFYFASLSQGSERETDRTVVFDLIGLLTMPVRAPMAKQQYAQAQLDATQQVLDLARDTRLAYFSAIASTQQANYAQDVQAAAEAARELAMSLAQAGNISQLDAMREKVFYAEMMAQRSRADSEALAAKEKLVRLLGLTDTNQLILPTTLPPLPNQLVTLNNVEQQALDQRLDVQQAKLNAENTARSLDLNKVTRFINVLDLGYQNNSYNDQSRQTGFEVSLELPLFDFGASRVAEAEAIYRRALANVAETAINARSEARESYAQYLASFELAKHYRDEVAPLQQQMSDEVLLRYNGMLISTFELLAQSREQIAATESGMLALRDFWLADAQLTSVLQGKNL
jgi:outer membrane protein TolC